jgi:hypothetical protein
MKKHLLFVALIVIGSGIYGQPSTKVFGFEQENSPGTATANIKDENGNPVKKAARQKEYFIYLSFKQKYNITAQQVFIHSKAFSAKASIVETTPVEHIINNIPGNPEKTTLVPKTSDKVIELKIVDPIQVKKTPALQKLTKKNDVVISYTWKKKKYFTVLKKLEKLDPILKE